MFQQKANGKEILRRRGIERSLIYAARLIPLYLTWFLLPLGSTSADLSCLIAARLWYGTNHLTSWALPLFSVKWNGHVTPLTLGCKWHNICGKPLWPPFKRIFEDVLMLLSRSGPHTVSQGAPVQWIALPNKKTNVVPHVFGKCNILHAPFEEWQFTLASWSLQRSGVENPV